MKSLKKYWLDIVAVVVFVVISFAYFMPADLEGRVLYHNDSDAGRGLGREQKEYYQQTGEVTRWTNSAFSGMPTYQMSPSYKSTSILSKVVEAYHLWLPDYVWYVFAYLLGFYILLRAFDFRQDLAMLGSIIWAFSSYFFIIIGAGHLWKVMALAYLPPMIAGVVLCYRQRYLWGFIVTAIFSAFEVEANHVQMTYYYLFIIAFMLLAFLIDALRKKEMKRFAKATLVCLAGALIGISINLSNLYHTWEYGKESMRGKSELTEKTKGNEATSGLDRDYITQWSYGMGETWTLLVPNAKGGANTIQLGSQKKAMEKCDPQYSQYVGQWYSYWGDQPFTAGPVYVGSFVLMLFILSLFLVKGPMKWCLLAVTVLSILLSWGRNFMPFTDFFIDHMPLYSKFRTVSSILVIAEFTIPLMAMLGLKAIIDDRTLLNRKLKYVYISFGLTAGFCLIFAVMPNAFFDFVTANDQEQLSHYVPKDILPVFLDNISKVRTAIFTADCWRSFFIIVVGTLLLLLYKAKKLGAVWTVGCITLLCLIDMWQVNKRYLNDGMFVEKSVGTKPIEATPIDKYILQDKSLDYRVLNMAGDTFNENNTSYFHKSIGGYHPAKLHRYNDLINFYIAPEMQRLAAVIPQAGYSLDALPADSIIPVLNMLNTKYIIMTDGKHMFPIVNHQAYGNAWMVDKVQYVENADAEIAALGKVSLRHTAVADKKFKEALGEASLQAGNSTVTLNKYAPNHLSYTVNSDKGGIVVFSEIYYPEWTATVDGKPQPLGRVDYVLRALNVKPGKHDIELDFHPASIKTTESIAYVSYVVLVIAIGIGLFMEWKRRKEQEAKEVTDKK